MGDGFGVGVPESSSIRRVASLAQTLMAGGIPGVYCTEEFSVCSFVGGVDSRNNESGKLRGSGSDFTRPSGYGVSGISGAFHRESNSTLGTLFRWMLFRPYSIVVVSSGMADEQEDAGYSEQLTAAKSSGEPITINVTVNVPGGAGGGSNSEVMTELQVIKADLASIDQRIEAKMSDLTGAETQLAQAVTDLAGRVSNDIAHLQDLQQQQSVIINQLQGQEVTDQATIASQLTQIADLQAQIDGAITKIADANTQLSNIDPAAPAPAPEPNPNPPTA